MLWSSRSRVALGGPVSDTGAQLWASKMSVDMMGHERDDLFDEVIDVINVSEFIEFSDGARIDFL